MPLAHVREGSRNVLTTGGTGSHNGRMSTADTYQAPANLTAYKVTVHPSETVLTVLATTPEAAATKAVFATDGVSLVQRLAIRFCDVEVA